MKTHFLVIIAIFIPIITFAQEQRNITGKVIDSFNEPIIGASILEKGTVNGTVTDLDGNFNLTVSPKATLVFSYIGYETQEIDIAGKSFLKIILKEDTELLEEVVVVGYGVQKKSSMTASVASISSKEIVKQTSSNVASALQGRTPGVDVIQQGGIAGADVTSLFVVLQHSVQPNLCMSLMVLSAMPVFLPLTLMTLNPLKC